MGNINDIIVNISRFGVVLPFTAHVAKQQPFKACMVYLTPFVNHPTSMLNLWLALGKDSSGTFNQTLN